MLLNIELSKSLKLLESCCGTFNLCLAWYELSYSLKASNQKFQEPRLAPQALLEF